MKYGAASDAFDIGMHDRTGFFEFFVFSDDSPAEFYMIFASATF